MSLEPMPQSIYPPMSEPEARSTLYRLIEAGQLAHKALLVPLLDRGLEPGDDAVIFVLHAGPADEERLADALGLPREALDPRLNRLIERDIIVRHETGLALSERGARVHEVLAANWEQLEGALFAELADKKRKGIDKALKRFVELLRLA